MSTCSIKSSLGHTQNGLILHCRYFTEYMVLAGKVHLKFITSSSATTAVDDHMVETIFIPSFQKTIFERNN